jgi:hypothetical protein
MVSNARRSGLATATTRVAWLATAASKKFRALRALPNDSSRRALRLGEDPSHLFPCRRREGVARDAAERLET